MIEQTSGNASFIFKGLALLLIVGASAAASVLAGRSKSANRLRKWLSHDRNARTTFLWLSLALVLCVFAGFTIAYKFRH